jgi:hypothetical protein
MGPKEQRILDTNAEKQRSSAVTDIEKMNSISVYYNFGYHISPSKSKYWHSNIYLHFVKHTVPLA